LYKANPAIETVISKVAAETSNCALTKSIVKFSATLAGISDTDGFSALTKPVKVKNKKTVGIIVSLASLRCFLIVIRPLTDINGCLCF
jgi:hypothetical protein